MLVLEAAVLLVLTLINAVFSGAEIAIVSVRTPRFRQLAEEGRRGARAVLALRAQPERFFATVQVAITVVGATAGAFGGATFAEDLEPVVARFPSLADDAAGISLAIVVAFVSYLSIVLGELVPKSLALKHAEAYALTIGPVVLAVAYLARPIVWGLTASSNVLLRPFGDHTTFTESKTSADELQSLLREAQASGVVDAQVGEIASRAFELAELTARDVMIPRDAIDAIPVDARPEELQDLVLERGHSRMPVYRGSLDDVVGYVMVKDLLAIAWEGGLVILQDVIRPAYFVRDDMLARDILREFQVRHAQLALVTDASGALVGLVTLEDILEELVGELFSEHDHPAFQGRTAARLTRRGAPDYHRHR
ncbi:hemolysin family protein [Myxococcota bacterium]|nr:hemolysin family protein [Myxococcota bacterium]